MTVGGRVPLFLTSGLGPTVYTAFGQTPNYATFADRQRSRPL